MYLVCHLFNISKYRKLLRIQIKAIPLLYWTVPLKPRLTIVRSSSFTKLPNAEDRKILLERSFIEQQFMKRG